MKNLIGMVDFVLDQEKIVDNSGDYRIFKKAFNLCEKYANFLKQPLELWMFIPCDEDGNVITRKYDTGHNASDREYQQAKERCLFEGFELKGQTDYSFVYKNKNIFPYFISKKGTIEDLTFHISNCDLQLTQTALKQLSL